MQESKTTQCECVCHKVGLLGLMCCPCSAKEIDELVNGKRTRPVAPSEPSAPLDKAQDGITEAALEIRRAVSLATGYYMDIEPIAEIIARRLCSQPMPQSAMTRNTEDPESRKYWEGIKATSDRVNAWPEWKRGVKTVCATCNSNPCRCSQKEVMQPVPDKESERTSGSATRATSEVDGVASPIPSEPPTQMYPDIWAVAHSGFLQSVPHTEKTAHEIVAKKSLNDQEWEAVRYTPIGAAASPKPEGPRTFLHKPNSPLPEGCYCEPGKCAAPVIMGRQMPCRDPQRAAGIVRCCENGNFGDGHECRKQPGPHTENQPAERPEGGEGPHQESQETKSSGSIICGDCGRYMSHITVPRKGWKCLFCASDKRASPVLSAAPTCPKCGDKEFLLDFVPEDGTFWVMCSYGLCLWRQKMNGNGIAQLAAFFSPQARGYTLLQGRNVYVDNPQFQGYGIAQYDSGERKRVIGVLLENGNTWEYDAATVRAAREDERDKFPPHMRLLASEE